MPLKSCLTQNLQQKSIHYIILLLLSVVSFDNFQDKLVKHMAVLALN